MELNDFREKHSFYLKPFVQSKTKNTLEQTGIIRNKLKQDGTTWIERESTVVSWNETEVAKTSTRKNDGRYLP